MEYSKIILNSLLISILFQPYRNIFLPGCRETVDGLYFAPGASHRSLPEYEKDRHAPGKARISAWRSLIKALFVYIVVLDSKVCPLISAPGTCFPRGGWEPPRHSACGVSHFPLFPAGVKCPPLQSTQTCNI